MAKAPSDKPRELGNLMDSGHNTPNLTAVKVRNLLDYNPQTGALVWKVDVKVGRGRVAIKAGTEAGHVRSDGQRIVGIDGKEYRAHRLIWLHVYGEWPNGEVDHINVDRTDNRLANLRLATRRQNQANMKRCAQNTSGFKGVCFDKARGKWMAYVASKGKRIYLGRYSSPEAAHLAYCKAADRIYGEFARFE